MKHLALFLQDLWTSLFEARTNAFYHAMIGRISSIRVFFHLVSRCHVNRFLILVFFFCGSLWLLGVSPFAYAEPQILIGPSEPDEEPEAVDTISGLSYDQLKKLRELRKWLDARQKIRDERDLKALLTESQSLSLFKERELLTPLGQRAPSLKIKSHGTEGEVLKLPPLPRFDDSSWKRGLDQAPPSPPSAVTHMTPPPSGHQKDGVQVEYELSPERALEIED